MKSYLSKSIHSRRLLSVTLAAFFALPLPSLAASVALATSPLTTSTASVVKPNVMFVLDDSGSMAWDYMPDDAKNFAGNYGFNSSQCNGTAYNPTITYEPPVSSTGAALDPTPTSFTAAYKDGYNTSLGTTNLSSGYKGGSGSGSSGSNLTAGPAFYYVYSGTQTTSAQKDYFNTGSVFYQECNSAYGTTTAYDGTHPVNTLFTKVRLAATPNTTITVSGAGSTTGGATLKINSASSARLGTITISGGGGQIMSGRSSSSSTTSSVATSIASKINACTTALSGSCTVTGYKATVSGSTITITGPAASGATMTLVMNSGSMTSTATAFPTVSSTTVSSIRVGGVDLFSGSVTATGSTTNGLASDIASKITATGYSATISGNIVTVTGPSSASTLTPIITVSSGAGSMSLTTEAFPESTPAKLQNFANWYSYYSHRMLMMKTGAGLAFAPMNNNYRIGFLTMNNNVSPGIVEVAPFNATQKSAWYDKLYGSQPGNMTPLREALSKVGQYYSHQFGTVTTYTARITVGGSGDTSVDTVDVNGTQIMADITTASTSTNTVAQSIANQINSKQVTDYGASVSGNIVTITGPAVALGHAPVITDDGGGMTFVSTSFTASSTTASLNGITPADPMEYSCQQNFTILSTDGYWNGSTTYNLAGTPVGQQDGSAARPMNDGAQTTSTVTTQYTRNDYSSSGNKIGSTGSNCSGTKKRLLSQPQIQSCTVTGTAAEVCGAWGSNGAQVYVSPYDSTSASCTSTVTLPSPDPSTRVVSGTPVTTPGTSGGVSNTLSDVAMYYYQTDLRTPALGNCTGVLGGTISVCENNVFISSTDNNPQQHMTTLTLGLGARGKMVYSGSYLTDTTGDYVAVKLGSTASSTVCKWQASGTVCNWPIPSSGAIENIDDLWHAAINGRGAFFSATDPSSLSASLSNALLSISSKKGSAAAAATSTLNPVAGNNFAYVASYTTVSWRGNLEARGINTTTGAVSVNASWCAENVVADTCPAPGAVVPTTSGDTTTYNCVIPSSTVCPGGTMSGTDCLIPVATSCTGTMSALVSPSDDNRIIKTANDAGTALINFDAAYATAHSTYFDEAHISGLSQWTSLTGPATTTGTQKNLAQGVNLVNYLRGQYEYEDRAANAGPPDNRLFRYREAVLGDALESQPTFISKPLFNYPYAGYSTFKSNYASREGTVFMGTNDGMIHAFNATDGTERWAYIPSMVIADLWQLADTTYSTSHSNFVNGSPVTTDICTANCTDIATAVWKTILVAGLNAGGRGYYALDITTPNAPALLWEFTPATCTTTAPINHACQGKVTDDDLGYSYGPPVVTRKADGTWVVLVTSGYNNTNPGNGHGYLYVLNAATGAIISKIDTGVGDTTTPSGLAKVSTYNDEPAGSLAGYTYGGDLKGNLWRFDINSTATAAIGTGDKLLFATLFSNAAGTATQPITTTPILGKINDKRVIYIGTGKYLETGDLSTTQMQTQYAIKDDNATSTFVNPRLTLSQQTMTNVTATNTRTSASVVAANFSSGRGWYADFPDTGERVNIDSKLIQGILIVPTLVPSSSSCSPGGYGWLNYFDYQTGAITTVTTGEKFDSAIVGVNVIYIDGTPIVEVVTSTNPTPTIPTTAPPFVGTVGSFAGRRTLWRELIPQ